LLKDGWVLQRGGPGDAGFTDVPATLITPNPTTFTVTTGGSTNVFFGFATSGGEIATGNGNANIRISVQDCDEFNGITAALATFTVDCTGTIGPDSYSQTTDGILSRNFTSCSRDPSKLASIDQLLSLQLRTVRLPFVKECIVGRWLDWKAQLAQNPVAECPVWDKQSTVNEATAAQIDKVIPLLNQLSQNGTINQPGTNLTNAVGAVNIQQLFDEGYVYGVTFASGAQPSPNQKCQTAGDCAALCAGGFTGFVVRNDQGTVLTDGPYWLLDNTYPGASTDPFLKPSYYHPMSYYGPSPGTQFANRNRFSPCVPDPNTGVVDPACQPEMCSYGASNIHLRLKCDCLTPANNSTCPASDTSCVGYCAP
jgi:hypothetical protein